MRHPASRVLAVVAVALAALGVPLFPQTSTVAPSPQDDVSLRIIVLETADEAHRVREALQRGENFLALATARSVDPSGRNGGMLGRLSRSSLRQELREAIRGLAAGDLSPIVPVPAGFAILQLVADRDDTAPEAVAAAVSAGLGADGSIKIVFDVGGFADATEALRQFPKDPGWEQDPLAICRMRSLSLRSAQDTIERRLADRTDLANPLDRAQAHVLLGQLHAYLGRMEPAIAAWERAFHSARDVAAARLPLLEGLGIAHLQKAAMENGALHTPIEPCLLCRSDRTGFARKGDAVRAVEYFSRYLAEKPDELEVRWLLNVAYMLLGGYPDDVPAEHLMAPAALRSVDDVGRFADVAAESGLVSFGAAGGIIVDDFDGDGRFDVVTSSMDSCQPMHLFRRSEDGRFVQGAAAAGLAGQLGGLNIVQADYDNDGCLDVLVLRGGWELPQRNSLLRNDCRGSFTDVTARVGLAVPATSTQTAAWTDFDNDGRLDLFVGNENGPAQLFRQQPDGTFVDVAAAAGVDRSAFTKGVTAGDYDNDGWPDLYASNSGGLNFLYRNNRDGTFTEIGRAAGVPGPGRGFPTWFFDYDNDGWQDLFVASFFLSVDESVRTYLGLPNNASTLKLYRNLGDGSFQDVTGEVGLGKVFMAMGANFGDIDNDGFLDIYLGTGNPSYASLLPNVLLRNRGGVSFVDVTASSGTGEWHKGHGVAFVDLDDDGDEEIVTVIGGATPGDAHVLRLYENPGHGNDWLNVTLIGRRTNRSAIGARLTVTIDDRDGQRRVIHRTVVSGGSFGASPLRQHVGLGPGARIVALDIWWPTSDTRQRFTDLTVNQSIEVTELAQDYRRVTPRPLPLGGPSKGQAPVP